MQQEMALRQDPANSGDWGRAGGSPGALSKTLNSQDSLSSLFMSDDDLKKYIDRDQQNLQAYYRSLMTPNGQPPSPDAGNVASAKVNAPVIGSPGDEAAAKAAQKAQENLLQLTNTLNGKDAGRKWCGFDGGGWPGSNHSSDARIGRQSRRSQYRERRDGGRGEHHQ